MYSKRVKDGAHVILFAPKAENVVFLEQEEDNDLAAVVVARGDLSAQEAAQYASEAYESVKVDFEEEGEDNGEETDGEGDGRDEEYDQEFTA